MSELQLRQDVLDELEFEPSVDAAHIGVAVEKDVVSLSGHVASYAEKLAAVTKSRCGIRLIRKDLTMRSPRERSLSSIGIPSCPLAQFRSLCAAAG